MLLPTVKKMNAKPKHFLILDDEESIRQSIAAYMEDEGYIVFEDEATQRWAIHLVLEHPLLILDGFEIVE